MGAHTSVSYDPANGTPRDSGNIRELAKLLDDFSGFPNTYDRILACDVLPCIGKMDIKRTIEKRRKDSGNRVRLR